MVVNKDTTWLVEKHDFIHITILLAIALGIGVYLIATTVLISKDGVCYIEQAQELSSHPIGVIKAHPPGYPFLIFVTHKFVGLFSNSSSVYSWIYSAQSVTLLCRLIALIPLYFIGKLLVGEKRSFWAILVLIMLPYPAEFGSDALRDWPHILFLATGFLFLLLGAAQVKWWMFGVAGLAAGLGHIIRPECAQLVIYGALWLLIRLLLPNRNLSRIRVVFALLILLIGFVIPAAPYMKVRERIMPLRLKALVGSSSEPQSQRLLEADIDSHNDLYATASLTGSMAKAIDALIEGISENLLYFFVLPLLVGVCLRFRRRFAATDTEKFFVPAFVVFNIIALVLLYYTDNYISRRHTLPLVLFTIFYVPSGLQALGDWLGRGIYKGRLPAKKNSQQWFLILLAIGFAVCLPKLLRPVGADKRGFRTAAKWLKDNTSREDTVAVPDKRISFYAERKGLIYDKNIPEGVKYVVKIVKSEDEELDVGISVRRGLSLWVDQRKKAKRIVIYKIL